MATTSIILPDSTYQCRSTSIEHYGWKYNKRSGHKRIRVRIITRGASRDTAFTGTDM